MEDNSLEVETTNDVREIIELNDAHQEIEAFDAEIESTAQDAEVIQDVQEVVAKAAEGEGLSPASAEIAEIVLESLYGRLGIQSKKSIMSLESYGDPKHRRQELTRVACESMSDTLLRIWTAIKEAFAKLWQNIKMFIAKIFSSVKIVRTELKKMEEKVKEFGDKELKPINIESSALCKAFSLKGKADFDTTKELLNNHTNLANNYDEFAGLCEKGLAEISKAADEITRENLQNGLKSEDGKPHDILTKYDTVLDKYEREFQKIALKSDVREKGSRTEGTAKLIGGKVLIPDLFKPRVVEVSVHIATTIQTLTKEEINILIKLNESLCDAIEKIQKSSSKITKLEKECKDIVETVIKRIRNNKDDKLSEDERAPLHYIQYKATDISRSYGFFATVIPKLSIEAVRHSLNYIRVSLQQVEKPEAA